MIVEYDFIVVGSGAGGGPLACRLAQDPAGYRVALIDAGTDPAFHQDGTDNFNYSVPVLHPHASEDREMSWAFFVKHYSDFARQKADSKYVPDRVPDPDGGGDPRRQGIFYPRAATLGGCTSHNAMITVYPSNEDWEYIRQLTGDQSWAPDKMRSYFERIENCRYAPMDNHEGRHGFGNWLSTSLLGLDVLKNALHEPQIVDIVLSAIKAHLESLLRISDASARETQLRRLVNRGKVLLQSVNPIGVIEEKNREAIAALRNALLEPDSVVSQLEAKFRKVSSDADAAERLIEELRQNFFGGMSIEELIDLIVWRVDPNDWRFVREGLVGLIAIPLATDGAKRSGPRELIQATVDNCPYRLEVLSGRLVTKIVFEGDRAIGVKFTKSPYDYTASVLDTDRKNPLPPLGQETEIRAKHEIILSGGAFNTPQLLMLSGIGPREELEKHQIRPLLGRFWPGVGRNLQDRYEVTVVSELANNFQILGDCSFEAPKDLARTDDCFRNWWRNRSGVYTTNGALFGVTLRSSVAEHLVPPGFPGRLGDPPPDLFLFAVLGKFKGYFPGYSDDALLKKNLLTWAILKAHTRNDIGDVTLRSADPREVPVINFRNFNDGNPDAGAEKDLQAIMEGVEFIQQALQASKSFRKVINPPFPLDHIHTSAGRKQLRQFIMNEAWGHHACGTCKIGRDSTGSERAVVSSDFKVHGLKGLRIVDASVFPKIPGFFIVTPIYMISEKAAEEILKDAARQRSEGLTSISRSLP